MTLLVKSAVRSRQFPTKLRTADCGLKPPITTNTKRQRGSHYSTSITTPYASHCSTMVPSTPNEKKNSERSCVVL